MAKSPGAPTAARKPQTPIRRQAVGADGLTKHVRYSHRLAAEICRRVGLGEKWSHFCCTDGMPSYAAMADWKRRYPVFAKAMAVAREEAAERKASRALEVAEGAAEGVPGDRLRVTTLMQLAALEAPHMWGGKPPPPELAEQKDAVRITFYIRQFETVAGPDGKKVVQEIPPEEVR